MFAFRSLGHFFAAAAHDAKACVSFVSSHQAQIDRGLETAAVAVSALDPALAPLAATIERAGEAVLGEVLAVVSKLEAAGEAKGVDVALDASVVAELKALLAAIEKLKPGSTKPAAGLVAA